MNHEKIKELIFLLINDELSRNEKSEIEKHLAECSECMLEYEEQKKLHNLFSNKKNYESFDRLLNEARLELHTTLRMERIKNSYGNQFAEKLSVFFSQPYKFAAAFAALLLVGFFIGFLVFNSSKQSTPLQTIQTAENFSLLQDNTRIANLRFINKDPNSGDVEFTFDAVKPMKMKGSVNDERIQNILTYSMLNEQNPGVRLNSVNAIGTQQPAQLDNDVKEALINVVKYDDNPGVRREAIKILQKFPYDEELKHAYLQVLLSDSTSGMRIEAINSLVNAKDDGYKFDENEISIFKKTMLADDNNYIRYRARTVVEEKK